MVAGEGASRVESVWSDGPAFRRRSLTRFFRDNRVLSLFTTVLLGLILVAFAADGLTRYNPNQTHPAQALRNAQLAFPGILLAIALISVLGPGLNHAMIAVGILGVPFYYRLTRGQLLQAKVQEYVRAAEVVGASRSRIMVRHILPNVANPLIVAASLAGGQAILTEAALSFLGIGAQPPTPDWGAMILIGTDYLQNDAWMAIGPRIAIVITVFSYYMLGDALRDCLDPRLRTR